MNYLQKLCDASGVLPASFTLADEFDDVEPGPFTSGGFADLYRATYKGQPVVAKALKSTYVDGASSEHVRKVSSLVSGRIIRLAYGEAPALCE